MNAAHLHLIVNHLPLFAALFAGALLAAGILRKHKPLSDAGLVLAIVAGLSAFAAAQTGERAEGIVENLPGVAQAAIESHEEAAEAAMFTAIALGVLALAALSIPARMARAKRAATLGSLAFALGAFALVGRAANLGGMIRHTEITDGASTLLSGHAEGEEETEVGH